MNFQAAQRYHERLLKVFNDVPRQRKDLALWNKSRVIARINRTFQDFLVEEASRLSQETETSSAPPIPDESQMPEPREDPEVFIPEWKPELEQPESEGDYD
jgi:hypothetical protein